MAADDQVIGVVGNLNSSVAQQTQPVFSTAKITQVSPANTNPTLTKGPDTANPKRQYATYFRTCTTDAVQGPFAARYLLGEGIKKVATIHDKKTYGQGLVAAFTEEFTKGGGQITSAQTINPDESNYQAVVSSRRSVEAPGSVYYGGEYPQAGPLSQQMKAAGLNVPLMGGDGIYDPKYIQLAGAAANGDLATSVGAPTDSTEAGKKFLADYQAAGLRRAGCGLRRVLVRRRQRDHQRAEVVAGERVGRQVGPRRHDRGGGQGLLRRGDRQGRLRRVGRRHNEGAHRVQGRRRQVGGGQDRHVQVSRMTGRRGGLSRPPLRPATLHSGRHDSEV